MHLVVKKKGSEDKKFVVKANNLLEALVENNINLDAPCSGKGVCGKCKIKVEGAVKPISEKEKKLQLDKFNERLACQTIIDGSLGDTIIVTLTEDFSFSAVEGLGYSEEYTVNQSLKKQKLFPLGSKENNDLLTANGFNKINLESINKLAELDARKKEGEAIIWQDEVIKIFFEDDSDKPDTLLAVALDLGTTGLSATIIDVENNKVLSHATSLNLQTAAGADVISRITYADAEEGNLKKLQDLALEGFRNLIKQALNGQNAKNIGALVVSGNTVMQHILAGVKPTGLALAPYRAVFRKSLDLSFLAEGFGVSPWAKILILPSISAYVGGDVCSGILATGFYKQKGTVLYIDIGTNGELVLNHNGKLFATSCAAGPTLEGMNIICGQRAVEGAIDSFIMAEDKSFNFTTIFDKKATGICGSGLIDICAQLVDKGIVNSAGKMNLEKTGDFLRFYITDKVFLDQKDVRQVQLAKGAIAAAIEMLLAKINLTEDDIDEIVVAGSFGYHLRPESLKSISMIPKNFKNKITFVGNSALTGSARIILDNTALDNITKIIEDIEVIELAFDNEFQNKFLMHLSF